jgi:hypothetical protein
MILRKYKNNLLTIIQERGIDPNLFMAKDETISKMEYFVISGRDTNIRFAVRPYYGSFEKFYLRYSEYLNNFPLTAEEYIINWEELSNKFLTFLKNVVKPYLDDISTPDLWHALQETGSQLKFGLGKPDDFKPFSDEEKVQIRLSLGDFKLLIVNNFNPVQEQLDSVNKRLDYLTAALEKHNKFDWKGIAINTVFSIIIALSLSPEQGNQLFLLFQQVFSKVLRFLPSP